MPPNGEFGSISTMRYSYARDSGVLELTEANDWKVPGQEAVVLERPDLRKTETQDFAPFAVPWRVGIAKVFETMISEWPIPETSSADQMEFARQSLLSSHSFYQELLRPTLKRFVSRQENDVETSFRYRKGRIIRYSPTTGYDVNKDLDKAQVSAKMCDVYCCIDAIAFSRRQICF